MTRWTAVATLVALLSACTPQPRGDEDLVCTVRYRWLDWSGETDPNPRDFIGSIVMLWATSAVDHYHRYLDEAASLELQGRDARRQRDQQASVDVSLKFDALNKSLPPNVEHVVERGEVLRITGKTVDRYPVAVLDSGPNRGFEGIITTIDWRWVCQELDADIMGFEKGDPFERLQKATKASGSVWNYAYDGMMLRPGSDGKIVVVRPDKLGDYYAAGNPRDPAPEKLYPDWIVLSEPSQVHVDGDLKQLTYVALLAGTHRGFYGVVVDGELEKQFAYFE